MNRLSVESRPKVQPNDTIHISFWKATNREYVLKFKPEDLQLGSLQAYLLDTYSGTETPIEVVGNETLYSFRVTDEPESKSLNRFKLVFQPGKTVDLKFLSFNAIATGAVNQLKWKVNTTEQIKHFVIERSSDGNAFETIAEINSNLESLDYQTIDQNPIHGWNHYRIQVVDEKGGTKFSNVVSVNRNEGAGFVMLYPTTITNKVITLELKNKDAGNYNLIIVNTLGQSILNKTIQHSGGNQVQNIDLNYAAITSGVYFVQLSKGKTRIKTVKIIVQ
jgi:hypothetical protein